MITRRAAAATPTLSSVANEVGTNVPTLLHKVEAFADQVWEDKKQLHSKNGVYNPAKGFTSSNGVLDFKWKPTLDMAEVLSRAASVNFESLRKKLASDPASREELAKVIGNSAAKWASRLDSWVGWLNNLLHKHLADAMDMQEAVAEDLGMGELMGHSQKWLVHPTRVRRSLYMSAKTESNFVNLSFEIQLDMAPNPGARSASHLLGAEGDEIDAARSDILRYFRTHGWHLGRDSQQRPTVTHPTGHIQIWLYPTGDVYIASGDVPDLRQAHHIPGGVLKFRDPHKFYQEVMRTVAIQDPEVLRARSAGVEAMEHDTQEALDKYLKEHPKADRSRHKVKPMRAEPHEVAAVHDKLKPPGDIAKFLSSMPTKWLDKMKRTPEQKALTKKLLADPHATVESLTKLHHDADEYYLEPKYRGGSGPSKYEEGSAEDQARAQAQALWRATKDALYAKVEQEKNKEWGKKAAKTPNSEEVMSALEELSTLAGLTSRFEEGKPADPTKDMSDEDAQKWEDMNDEYGDKFKAAKVNPRSPAGTVVVLKANPAARALYTGLPPNGTQGKVSPVAMPGGKKTYLPGPGGGLIYVAFDNGEFMGVSPNDLDAADEARTAAEVGAGSPREIRAFRSRFSRFEEGKPADPTKDMSEEDAQEWEDNTEKYKDKFKAAGFAEGEHADPTENMSDADAEKWDEMHDKYEDKFKKEAASFRSFVEAALGDGAASPEVELERLSRFERGKPADPTKHMSDEDAEKWQNMNDKYGDKFKAAADREETFATAVRAIHDAAVRVAKQAFKSAPDVSRFFRVRADQRGCEVSRILGGTLSLMGATSPAGRAASAEACGLYGLPATTVQAGLQACAQLEAAAGRVAAGLLRGMDPADQPGVVAQMRSYARRNRCLRARLLATCAPPIGP